MTLRLVHSATAPTAPTATAPTASRRGAVWFDVFEPLRAVDVRNELYLIPRVEREDGGPGAKVTLWSCVGEGLPQPAWLGRWKYLARIHPRAVLSVLASTLREHEAFIAQLAKAYTGSTSNTPDGMRRGQWRALTTGEETELSDLRVVLARGATYAPFAEYAKDAGLDVDALAARVRAARTVDVAALAVLAEARSAGTWLDTREVEDALRRAVAP